MRSGYRESHVILFSLDLEPHADPEEDSIEEEVPISWTQVGSPKYLYRRSLRCQTLLLLQFLSQHLFACIHAGLRLQPILVFHIVIPLTVPHQVYAEFLRECDFMHVTELGVEEVDRPEVGGSLV